MTQGTGQRSYRACLRCRRRKTRCNLDAVGDPKKPPCAACHNSGSECILVASKRGGPFRRPPHHQQDGGRARSPASPESDDANESTGSVGGPPHVARSDHDGVGSGPSEDAHMELRNPSDALQILACSGRDAASVAPSSYHPSTSPGTQTTSDGCVAVSSTEPHPVRHHYHQHHHHHSGGVNGPNCGAWESRGPPSTTTALDEYELVRKFLLHPILIAELLQVYAQEYHSYCPIVPRYLLGESASDKIQKSDHFLLTVILTIASRDLPQHTLTHRCCWDYTQRLLSEVLLAHPWAQSPRTVQGLLLLSEWLPHIQIHSTSSEPNKTLFGEDRTAWSLVGLAVRQAYLLRLDQAAFRRVTADEEFQEREEQKRIIWTFVYLTDRQISARLGQAFWSRGPAPGSHLTADDFPSLKPTPGLSTEDLSGVLQATIELTQILHNAHGILYSSTTRTLDMIHQGDYARYLDDFQRAASIWYESWSGIRVRGDIRNTLLIMYEYICIYVNAFSFQAVLTRAASSRHSGSGRGPTRAVVGHQDPEDVFRRGIMSTWDGQYIFNASNAARKLLGLINDPHTRHRLCYMPSRYLIYGVYAAVFLHKALCARVFRSTAERREVTELALEFTSTIEKAPAVQPHICREYGRMLRNLWHQTDTNRDGVMPRRSDNADMNTNTNTTPHTNDNAQQQGGQAGVPVPERVESDFHAVPSAGPVMPDAAERPADETTAAGDQGSWHGLEGMDQQFNPGYIDLGSDMPALQSVEGYFSGSFLPGVTDFGQQGPSSSTILGLDDAWMGGF